jgi:hypothetical protein
LRRNRLGRRLDKVVYRIEKRNQRLEKETKLAARQLLCSARSILLARRAITDVSEIPSISSTASYHPDPPSSNPSSSPLPPNQPPNTPSSPLSSSSCHTVSIQSLPFEIIDLILSLVPFPGQLSSRQHLAVVRFAEDRSTLREDISSSDFYHKTDCERWASEDEAVNRGFATESYADSIVRWVNSKEEREAAEARGEGEWQSLEEEPSSEGSESEGDGVKEE